MLLQRSQISLLSRPSQRVLAAYKDHLMGAAIGGTSKAPMKLIYGEASNFLDDPIDLVTLQKPTEGDFLSRYLRDHWLFKRRSRSNADLASRTTRFENSHIVRTVSVFNLILAALLLIGAIVNLYFVDKQKAKLGLIALYTLLFASSMMLCTTARRAEVFAATAAYAAVLVVFVSGDLGGTEQCFVQIEGGLLKKVQCSD
jgi:hypothetical protein